MTRRRPRLSRLKSPPRSRQSTTSKALTVDPAQRAQTINPNPVRARWLKPRSSTYPFAQSRPSSPTNRPQGVASQASLGAHVCTICAFATITTADFCLASTRSLKSNSMNSRSALYRSSRPPAATAPRSSSLCATTASCSAASRPLTATAT